MRQCTVNGVDYGPFPNLGFDQVKPVDPETFVLGANANRTGAGTPALWRWRTGELEALGAVEYDAHDISAGWRTPYVQRGGGARGELDGFWAMADFSKTASEAHYFPAPTIVSSLARAHSTACTRSAAAAPQPLTAPRAADRSPAWPGPPPSASAPRSPRRVKARHKPATTSDLPTSDPVPSSISAGVFAMPRTPRPVAL